MVRLYLGHDMGRGNGQFVSRSGYVGKCIVWLYLGYECCVKISAG
jgi:hypothetical protein